MVELVVAGSCSGVHGLSDGMATGVVTAARCSGIHGLV